MLSRYARRARSHASAGIAASLAEGLDDISCCSGQQIGVNEAIEVAVQDALGVSDLMIGSMVFDQLGWVEDIATDWVAAEPHADDAPFLRSLLLPFLLGELDQPRFEDPHGGLLVGGLGALVLALDDHARRKMRDPDRRIGLVDVLTPCALGSVGVDP